MRLIQWRNPWLGEGFEKIFDELATSTACQTSSQQEAFVPRSDVIEGNDHFTLSIDLPGMEKDKIGILVEEGVLTISGDREHVQRVETDHMTRSETVRGSFRRSFRLPDTVEPDAVEARYENGVLELRIPKREEVKPKQIEVKVK